MAFDLSRLRKAFDPSKETPPDDPYKYRTPPFVPENTGPSVQDSLNSAFAGPGSASLYPDSYLNAGQGTYQPQQQQAPSQGIQSVGQDLFQPIQHINQSKMPQPINAPTGGVALGGQQTTAPLENPYDQSMSEDFKEVPYRTPPGRDTPAYDAYKKGIEEMPQMNKPSTFRRISAAVLGGMTQSPQNAEFIVHKPYYDAMVPWQAKMPHLQNAANQERQIMAQEDRDAYNDLIAQWRYDNLARQTQEGQQRIGIAQQNANTSRFRAEATERYQAEKNRITTEAMQGGQIVYNKMTGDAYLKKGNGQLEPIPNEVLQGYSFEEELQLRNAGRLLIVDTQAEYARRLQEDRDREAAARQKAALDAKGGPDALTPPEVKVDQYNRARQYLNSNPNAASIITLGDPSTNDFQLIPPTAPGVATQLANEAISRIPIIGPARDAQRKATEVEYDKAGRFIYGVQQWEQMKAQRTGQPAPPQQQAPPAQNQGGNVIQPPAPAPGSQVTTQRNEAQWRQRAINELRRAKLTNADLDINDEGNIREAIRQLKEQAGMK